MIGHHKNVFLAILTLMFFATIMPNILKYIQILLKFLLPAHIYKQFFDKPNLIYAIALIKKIRSEDLAFVIPSAGIISDIPKTMIFVDLIDEAIEIVKYLWSKLSKHIKKIKQPNIII